MAKNEVVKAESRLPSTEVDYGEDAGIGFENQGAGEMMIPFLSLLQGLSPQCQEGGPENAKPGRFFNTVTEEVLLSDAVLFVPAHYEHVFVEWKKRAAGGGFVSRYPGDDPVVTKAIAASKTFGKYDTEAGNDLIETFYLYGALCAEGQDPQPVVVAFTSTKIKVFRKWNTALNMFMVPTANGGKQRPPRFAHLVRLGSVSQKNTKGTFYNLVMAPANGSIRESLLASDDERFIFAKALREMVIKGAAKAAFDKQNVSTVDADAGPDGEVF